MGNINREMAQRVWQRVQTAQPDVPALPIQPAQQLHGWILEEWQTAQRYIALQRQLPKYSQELKKLLTQKQSQIACLKGIYRMVAGGAPKIAGVAPKQEQVNILMRKCYGSLMRCLAQYEAASRDPEYGSVYTRLAEQNRTHCQSILTILGNIKTQ